MPSGDEVEEDLVKVGARAPDDQVEWLWAKQLDDHHAELRNYPLFTYGLNWGDIVRCELDEEGIPWVADVVERSGNGTIRLFFESGLTQDKREEILRALNDRDVWYESTDDPPGKALFTFNVRPHVNWEELLDFLAVQEEQGFLKYEDGS